MGEPCFDSFECVDTARCDTPEGGSENICVPIDDPVDPSEPEEPAFTLLMNQGEACGLFAATSELKLCRAGLSCLGLDPEGGDTEGTCEAPLGAGQACVLNGDCAAPLECVEGSCAMSSGLADGRPCDFNGLNCASGYCDVSVNEDGGLCAPYPTCTIAP